MGFLDDVKHKADQLSEKTSGAVGAAKDAVGQLGDKTSSALGAAKGVVGQLGDKTSSAVGAAKDAVGHLGDNLHSALSTDPVVAVAPEAAVAAGNVTQAAAEATDIDPEAAEAAAAASAASATEPADDSPADSSSAAARGVHTVAVSAEAAGYAGSVTKYAAKNTDVDTDGAEGEEADE